MKNANWISFLDCSGEGSSENPSASKRPRHPNWGDSSLGSVAGPSSLGRSHSSPTTHYRKVIFVDESAKVKDKGSFILQSPLL